MSLSGFVLFFTGVVCCLFSSSPEFCAYSGVWTVLKCVVLAPGASSECPTSSLQSLQPVGPCVLGIWSGPFSPSAPQPHSGCSLSGASWYHTCAKHSPAMSWGHTAEVRRPQDPPVPHLRCLPRCPRHQAVLPSPLRCSRSAGLCLCSSHLPEWPRKYLQGDGQVESMAQPIFLALQGHGPALPAV